jgi:hypothetical protein
VKKQAYNPDNKEKTYVNVEIIVEREVVAHTTIDIVDRYSNRYTTHTQ